MLSMAVVRCEGAEIGLFVFASGITFLYTTLFIPGGGTHHYHQSGIAGILLYATAGGIDGLKQGSSFSTTSIMSQC